MSFLSKALRRAEDFLEQVDESVAQASRRMVVQDVTGEYDDHAWLPSADDPLGVEGVGVDERRLGESIERPSGPPPPIRRSRGVANIPKAPSRVPLPALESKRLGAVHTEADSGAGHATRPTMTNRSDVSTTDGDGSEEGWGADQGALDIKDDPKSSFPTKIDTSQIGNESSLVVGQVDQSRKELGTIASIAAPNEDSQSGLETTAAPILTAKSNASGAERNDHDEQHVSSDVPADHRPRVQHVTRVTTPSETSEEISREADKGLHESQADGLAAILQENEELRNELQLVEEDIESLMDEREKHILNVQRLKSVVADMDETLKEKSADLRRLQAECSAAKDARVLLEKQFKDETTKNHDAMELVKKEFGSEVRRLEEALQNVHAQENMARLENARLKEALTHGRESDMATADGARMEASHAHEAYEREVAAHLETRNTLKEIHDSLESQAALTAEALAAAQRKADEASIAASNAKSAQRAVEGKLARISAGRDAAIARINDLEQSLAQYEGINGLPPGREELASLQQTVSELENALEAKNVELTRLEGEVENMRGALQARSDNAASQRIGSPGPGGSDQYGNSHEIEQKLRHMADSALRKQAQVEALRSENNALQHQLETERKRTREAQAMAAAATSSRHTLRGGFRGIIDISDEERGERSYGIREGPIARFRAPRSWPRAFSRFFLNLDKVSAEVLVFLRKEPLLRMVIVIYLCALHVFVYCLLHYHVESSMGTGSESTMHAAANVPHTLSNLGAKLEHIGAVVGHR